MTWLGRIMSLAPAALLAGALACVSWMCAEPGVAPVAALLGVLYLVPPLAFRLHDRLFPLTTGVYKLVGGSYTPWWGGHQLQALYVALPALEALLRVVPGLYSAWLRLWGAKVGKGVYWTPRVDITDRSLLRIGDRVVVGHRAGIYAHFISPARGNLHLVVKPITIEDEAFLGGYVILTPGSRVSRCALVPAGTHVRPNEVRT